MPRRRIEQLIQGYRTFRRIYFAENRSLFEKLATKGQSPKIMLIGCADARVDPLLITGAEPGDLFVVRNVANLVPPYAPDGHYHGTSAALEFAVRTLEVEHVIVLGHAQCGGVRALLRAPSDAGRDDFIAAWMSIATPARLKALRTSASADERQRACEFETVKLSLDNLATFPWIAQRVADGRLALHGWYFDVHDGRLLQFDRASQTFREI
jgi:carbonic anhydrase